MVGKIHDFFRQYRKVVAIVLSGMALCGAAAVAVPGDTPDSKSVKSVVLSWKYFSTNAGVAPEPYRFAGRLPPEVVMKQRLNDIKVCLENLWVDCPHRSALYETMTANTQWLQKSIGLQDLGCVTLNVVWRDITIVDNKAEVTAKFTGRGGGLQVDSPSPGVWISEQTVTEKFTLVKQNGQWKLSSWRVVSGGGSGEVIHHWDIPKADLEDPEKIKPILDRARGLLTIPEETRKHLNRDLIGPYL